jgi:hypothetical protein
VRLAQDKLQSPKGARLQTSPTSPDPPLRCTAAEIAAVLRDAARPDSWVVVSRPAQEWGESAVRLITAKLWKVALWRNEQGLQMTMEAVSPDRRHWQHGCERRWLEDGSVIEPLELLSQGERQALDQRLLRAMALPSTGMCPLWTPAPHADKTPVKGAKGGRKKKAKPTCQKS